MVVEKLSRAVDFRKPLVKKNCHSLSYIDVLLLELTMKASDLMEIRKVDCNFKAGRLHDEVINSLFSVLTKETEKFLYVGLTTTLSVAKGNPFRRMWQNKSSTKVEIVFINV